MNTFLINIINRNFQLSVDKTLPEGDICQWQPANASLMRLPQICDNIKFDEICQHISYLVPEI